MRLVQFAELTPAELGAWERLAARAAEPNPFFEPGFLASAAQTLGDSGAQLLVVEDDVGGWIGCMPVKPVAKLPGRVALGTWSHHYSFLGTPLVDRDRLDAFAVELVDAMESRRTGYFLVLRELDEGPVLAAIRRAIESSRSVGVAYERSFQRAAVERRPEPDYLASLKPGRLKRLAGRRRKLEEAVDGDLSFGEMSCEQGAVETFLALEKSGWKGKQGTAMACDPKSAEFFARMCEWFDQRDRLRMRVMQGEGKTIVMICNVAAGKALFSFKTAFDEDFRKYAPGLLLQVDDFEAWHERDQEDFMDSCGEPNAQTLNEFWPDRRTISTLVVGPRGLTARAARVGLGLRYSQLTKRLAALVKRRSTRLGVAFGFIAQQPAFELCERYAATMI